MNKLRVLLPLVLLFCFAYIACNKDDVVTFGPGVTVTFAGRILDEAGQAVAGAQVRAGSELATTDQNGVFKLKPVHVASRNAILYVNKIGYFDFSRAYQVQNNAFQTVTIQLLSKVQVGTVNFPEGGSVDMPSGAKLVFPALAVANKNGSAYSGTVRVFASYLDPTDPKLTFKMPGDLRGTNKEGNEQMLSTFGMIGVELESPSGEVLQVASGREVELSMPIPAGQAAAVPSEIPLWHYDTENASWVEEGSAQKVGNEYIGKVKHFSFWNCDFSYDRVNLTGKVYLDDLQHPLVGAQVWIGPADVALGWGCGHGDTDENGCFSGGVPKDIPLAIHVISYGQCDNTPIYTALIGPFSGDVTLPSIIIATSTLQTIAISGHLVDCGGQVVNSGYAKINWGGYSYTVFSDANGDFEIHIPTCNNNTTAGTIIAYDLVNLLESGSQTFTTPPSNVALGNIQVCNTLAEFIQYTLDGQLFTNVDPTGSILADTLPSNLFHTYISSFDSLQNSISLSFKSNNQPGTFTLDGLYASPYEVDISNSSLSTTVTATAANIGDLIIGTFGTSFTDLNGNSHTISGSYRVKRDW